MRTSVLRLVLLLSILVNLGVIGALGWRAMQSGNGAPGAETQQTSANLPGHLQLSDEQLRRWREAERAFLESLTASAVEIGTRRGRMIREIFSESPDAATIEAERAGIARLQEQQQRLVIAQLLAEREMLEPRQRELLAQVLLEQQAKATTFEQLHRD